MKVSYTPDAARAIIGGALTNPFSFRYCCSSTRSARARWSSAVKAGSPAARAGISGGTSNVTVQGEQFTVGGDVITAVNGKPVTSAEDLVQAITAYNRETPSP